MQGFGKIPILAMRIGNNAHTAHVQGLTESFIVAEQKKAIFLEGATGRASELISAEGRNRSLVEGSRRIESAVAQELKNGAVKLIRSGLGDNADLRSGALAVFGGISIGEHVEFADGVDPQQISRSCRRE